MKAIGIIPARLEASRFPNKPMALIHGMPMIGHCYHRTRMALGGGEKKKTHRRPRPQLPCESEALLSCAAVRAQARRRKADTGPRLLR